MARPQIWQNTVISAVNCSTVAYTANDNVGGKLGFAIGAPGDSAWGIIKNVVVTDLSKSNLALDVTFFRSDPSATTFTDNTALDVADADAKKIIGVAIVTASDYVNYNDNSVAQVSPDIAFKLNGTSVLAAAVVTRGAPTYAAADLQILLNII